MVMRNGCLTRLARLAENKHIATHTKGSTVSMTTKRLLVLSQGKIPPQKRHTVSGDAEIPDLRSYSGIKGLGVN